MADGVGALGPDSVSAVPVGHTSQAWIEGKPNYHDLDTHIVNGQMGNPLWLNDDDVFAEAGYPFPEELNSFYILVAGRKGAHPKDVARDFKENHPLYVQPFVANNLSRKLSPNAERFTIYTDEAYTAYDQRVADQLAHRQDYKDLKPLHGDKEYYAIKVSLPNKRATLFGNDYRLIRDAQGQVQCEDINFNPVACKPGMAVRNRNSRKFDLIQTSVEGTVERLHRGGLAIFDRQDPYGTPDYLHGINTADWHLNSRNDEFAIKIMIKCKGYADFLEDADLRHRFDDWGMNLDYGPVPRANCQGESDSLYLRFNNPNANIEAFTKWVNEEFDQGRVDWVQILGDGVGAVGMHSRPVDKLINSNIYFLARAINGITAPVFFVPGNHEEIAGEFPATVNASNFNLSAAEVLKLEQPPYDDIGLFIQDMLQAVEVFPGTLISLYDLVNATPDFKVNFGKGRPRDDKAVGALFVFANTGAADAVHEDPNDPVYEDLQAWYWELPLFHPTTLIDFLVRGNPDVHGATPDQTAWQARVLHTGARTVLYAHTGLRNTRDALHYSPENDGRVRPLTRIPNGEDIHYNTSVHHPNEPVVFDSDVYLSLAGHVHSDREGWVTGKNRRGELVDYHGTVRAAFASLPADDEHRVEEFWDPRKGCLETCSPKIHQLYEPLLEDQVHDSVISWHVGATGASSRPVFSRLTLAPNDYLARSRNYYINKRLEASRNNPHLYRTRLVVEDRHRPNDALAERWAVMRVNDPRARLSKVHDLTEARLRRGQTDLSFLPSDASLKTYPQLRHYVRDPQHFPTQYDPRAIVDIMTDLTFSDLCVVGASTFSRDQVGAGARLFFEGLEAGWCREQGEDSVHGAVHFPNIISHRFEVPLILEMGGYAAGVRRETSEGGATGYYDRLELFRLTGHVDLPAGFHALELGVFAARQGVLTGDLRGLIRELLDEGGDHSGTTLVGAGLRIVF
jgi:hypothetical protein